VDTQQCFVFFLEVRVTVSGVTILSVAQQCFYGEFMSPATMKPTLVFMRSALYFCLTLTEFGISRQIFTEASNVKFYGNPGSGRRADVCGVTDGHN